MRLALTLFLVLFTLQAANAEFKPWMIKAYKQANPNELAYWVGVHPDCPISRAEVVEIMEGVFVRSRIKPLGGSHWTMKPLNLTVSLGCMKHEYDNPMFSIHMRFGDSSREIPIEYVALYSYFGMGGKEFIKTALRARTEAAMTDYLKANFDLGD